MDDPSNNRIAKARIWAGRLIEVTWLIALLTVPMAFSPPGMFAFFETPKLAIMRVAGGGIVALWVIDLALLTWQAGVPSVSSAWASVRRWLAVEPLRWTVVVVAAYVIWVAASTLSSAIPRVAFWGFEYGRDGQSMYSIGSVTIVFFAVALRVRSQGQVVRLVGTVLLSGLFVSIYALLQSQGWDPYDLSRVRPGRVIGTLRNPIFLAAFLLPILPLALAAILILWERTKRPAIGIAATLVPAAILLVIALTLARGPWAGAATAAVVLAGFVVLTTNAQARLRGLAVLVATAVLAGSALIFIPTPTGEDSIDATIERLGSFSGEVQGNVSKRRTIWETSLELVGARPWFEFESGASPILRHLFGYGPDSFVYVYSLEAEADSGTTIKLVKDGHNLWLHNAVEIGVIGALLLLAAYAIPVLLGAYLLLFRYRDFPLSYRLLTAALIASIAGRGVEQLAGVTQTADSLLSWVLIGLLVALPSVVGRSTATVAERPLRENGNMTRIPVVMFASVVLAATVGLTWVHTNDNLLGARDAALSVIASRDEGDLIKAVELVNSAIDHAPAVAAYRLRAAALFDNVRLTSLDIDDQALIDGSLTVLREGLHHNRLSFLLNVETGESLLATLRQGDTSVLEEGGRAFEVAAGLFPNVRDPNRTTAQRLLELGLPERSIPFGLRTFDLSTDDEQRADAMFLVGVGLRDAGQLDAAIEAFEKGIELAPDGPIVPTFEFLINAILEPEAST